LSDAAGRVSLRGFENSLRPVKIPGGGLANSLPLRHRELPQIIAAVRKAGCETPDRGRFQKNSLQK
jgi:hypothetical protein